LEQSHADIQNAEYRAIVYEGAPHGLMYTHMEALTDDILRFIRET
jgi:non-heme chloroperoxidase